METLIIVLGSILIIGGTCWAIFGIVSLRHPYGECTFRASLLLSMLYYACAFVMIAVQGGCLPQT